MFEITPDRSLEDKLRILSDAAKYDVACTSSGVDRRGKQGHLGNSCAAGICHSFAADGRCISLLKILMTNHCVYDCKYCLNRKSNDIPRATFTPEEICTITMEFYRRNYIEGLFLSSGVDVSPASTMERMCETLRLLRTKYRFNGYIHIKAIPGAPEELIYSAGLLADRISINMELPTAAGLKSLAPNKSMETIMRPMSQISGTIATHRLAIGKSARMERSTINAHLAGSIFNNSTERLGTQAPEGGGHISLPSGNRNALLYPAEKKDAQLGRPFAAAGQSTQVIVGATPETDLDLVRMSQALYSNMYLKRVFYSAYIPINDDPALPEKGTAVPLLREHRLYQSDWLLRFYGFQADELLSEKNPFFDERIDPKCFWAVTHLENFPVEINTASHDQLLRVPGIGPKSVQRIVRARRFTSLNFEMLKKMGVVLKRAQYFITCSGRMMNRIPFEQRYITESLAGIEHKDNYRIMNQNNESRQLDLFQDFGLA